MIQFGVKTDTVNFQRYRDENKNKIDLIKREGEKNRKIQASSLSRSAISSRLKTSKTCRIISVQLYESVFKLCVIIDILDSNELVTFLE